MFHGHVSSKLDATSFLLHSKPSLSQASLNTSTNFVEDSKTNQQNDIFQAKTEAEICHNYRKILLTYGKWNAEAYLKILNELTAEEEKVLPLDICSLPNVQKSKCTEIKQTTAFVEPQHAEPPKYDKIRRNCRLHKMDRTTRTSRMSIPVIAHVQEDLDFPTEPTYKRIFKNGKLKRNPRKDESLGEVLTVPSSKRSVKQEFVEEPIKENSVPHREPCTLAKDEPNNYLLYVRRYRSEKDRKKVSFGSASELYMDDIERYYQNRPIHTVLENNLEDQIQLMRAKLKSHVTEVSGLDLLSETGYNDLRSRCLNDSKNIAEFQQMFNDSRWRKKFELEQIEESDNADSLDVSDIASSESTSVCSGDSLETELDYKPKPIPPSRIPCIAEVREMGDILFDKIAMKWERTIKKNFIDAKMKPCFTNFCHAIRLRSTEPVYSNIKKLLEPNDDFYKKKFTPHRYRMKDKLEKMDEMRKTKDAVVRQRCSLESCQIRRGWRQRSPSQARIVDVQEPTKYRGQNQRHRLERIMQETKRRGKEGLTDWTKQALMKDYVNLKPIIQTKSPQKNKPLVISEPTMESLPAPSNRAPRKIAHMQSLRNFETSLFLQMPTISPSPSSPSRSRIINSSRLKLRMPI